MIVTQNSDSWLALARATNRRSLWTAMLAILRERFNFSNGILGFPFDDGIPADLASDATPRSGGDAFRRRMTNPNPAAVFTEAHPEVKVAEISEALTPGVWEQHPLYLEMFAPQGWYYALGLFFRQDGRFFALLAFARSRETGNFAAEDHAVAEELHPHFGAAIERVWEIECRNHTAKVLVRKLRQLPQALALFDGAGQLLWCTRTAASAAKEWGASPTDGGGFTLPQTAFEALGDLLYAIDGRGYTDGIDTPPPSVCVHPAYPKLYLQLSAERPVRAGAEVLFFVHFLKGAKRPLPDKASRWAALLSPAEIRVAEAAMGGLTNREIASNLHLSIHTVSAHLRRVFAKLDIESRSALSARLS